MASRIPTVDNDGDALEVAYDIATRLLEARLHGHEGITVLAMALGIYMEARQVDHEKLLPISDAVCQVAQQTFVLFQAYKSGPVGHG